MFFEVGEFLGHHEFIDVCDFCRPSELCTLLASTTSVGPATVDEPPALSEAVKKAILATAEDASQTRLLASFIDQLDYKKTRM